VLGGADDVSLVLADPRAFSQGRFPARGNGGNDDVNVTVIGSVCCEEATARRESERERERDCEAIDRRLRV